MEWVYTQPVKIIFGSNKTSSLHRIFKDLKLKNGLLICDPYFYENGLASKILGYSKGLLVETFIDFSNNVTLEDVDHCSGLIKEKHIEFIVSVGGGNALSCAKVAASLCKTELTAFDIHSGDRKLEKEHIPIIAIPTTAGTGSEVSNVAMLTDSRTGARYPITSNNFYPTCAIIDPALTLSMPQHITAATAFDVLSHALEGFWSKNHQPVCDAMAIHASKLVFENLLLVYEDGSNLKAREKMSEASVIAGLAFSLPRAAGIHACSYPLTSIYNMPHGEACAFTLDSFIRINAEAEDGRLHGFANQLGFKDAYEMADKILEMKKLTHMKITLTDAGIHQAEIVNLAMLSMHEDMLNNPVEMNIEKLIEMFSSLA